ncbi:hypothetical protein AB0K60_00285 [Thermopolyspora sp. NPDC052614]|uniref:hypothetical protein n=1 Tax=Thermopolyspora sp. NPDC052614 TaxID=3155682 RepID=UPI003446A125
MFAAHTPDAPGSGGTSSPIRVDHPAGSGTAAPAHGPAASPASADPGTATAVRAPATPAPRSLVSALSCGVGLLLAIDLVGAWISVAAGLNPTFLDALGPEARLSAPIPMMIAQIVMVVAATRSRRAVAIAGCLLLTIAGLVAFLSGFYDGGYAADLTPFQRVYQITLVAAHLGVSVLASAGLVRLLRRGRPTG